MNYTNSYPVLSIITPIYNGEKFIEECLKSVINQKCLSVEHIIVDGGSNDETIKIVKTYAEHYPHIRWFSEPDDGQSDAMNKGILRAKGKILGFLNADDFYEQNVLNRVIQLFEKLPEPTFLVGNCNLLDSNNHVYRIDKPSKICFYDLLLGYHINPHPANPSAYFYHKSLHDLVGLYVVEDHYTMDLDFILRAVQVANIKYINEIWGNFKQHENSKTVMDSYSNVNANRRDDLLENYRKGLPLYQQSILALKCKFIDIKSKMLQKIRRRWMLLFQ